MKFLFQFLTLCFALTLFTACGPEGEKIEAEDAKQVDTNVAPTASTYMVDAGSSMIKWEGSKVSGSHFGTLNITDGKLMVADGMITGGEFNMDMNSITVTDLEPGKGKEKLEGHLKTGDFFEVEKYGTAKFVITGAKPVTEDGVTHHVTGNLTMRDITKSITIPVEVAMSGDALTAKTPAFTIDRNEWGIDYAGAEDNLINKNIGLEIQLKANKNMVGSLN